MAHSDAPKANLFGTLHRRRREIGLAYRGLALVAALSVFAALGQAATLLVVVRVATAFTASTESISGTVGPISASDLSTRELIAIGFALVLFVYVVELLLASAQASLQVNAQRSCQQQLLREYGDASYEAQTLLSRGETQQLVFNHANQAASVVASLGTGLSSLLNFVVLVGSALYLSPVAAAVAVAGLLLILALLRPLTSLSRRTSRQQATEQRQLGKTVTERLELTKEVTAFGVGSQFNDVISQEIEAVSRSTRRLRVLARSTTATYRAGALMVVLVMMVIIDATDATNLAALTGALLMLIRSMGYGQTAQSVFQTLSEQIPIVEQLVDEENRLRSSQSRRNGTNEVPTKIGEIRFDDVGFSYDESPVLSDVRFTVDEGTFCAFIGRSGAGKSTAMSLLMGLQQPSKGAVRFDGVDLSTVDESWLHSRLAYVPQEPKLRSGTVMETIRFLRDEISDDSVVEAAHRAHIAEEILSWPAGFDTQIGQLGDKLSGGQRQRISIARALAGTPELLLLDEPTSSLDAESEALISQTLSELKGAITIVVIAHRLRTVEHADRAIVFHEGTASEIAGPSPEELAVYFNEGEPDDVVRAGPVAT